jgi:chromosome segregation ATPase
MGYWPFVTIFVSLVLILFFRRLDKRNISFAKFKKYAEKLSQDFNSFLGTKREELQDQLRQLEQVVARAEAVLNRIETAEEALSRTHSQVQTERVELDMVKLELEKLKVLKHEISEETEKLGKSLPSLKTLTKRVDRITLDIAENEKAIRNTSSIIPTIEKRVQEKTDRALEEASGMLIEETHGRLGSLIEEYTQNLQMLSETGKRELATLKKETGAFVSRANEQMSGFMDSIQSCQDRVRGVEEGKLVAVERRIDELDGLISEAQSKVELVGEEVLNSFLKRAEDGFEKYVALLEDSRDGFKADLFEKVEAQAKDLSSYIARLEGRVQSLLESIKEETDKYGEALHLKAKAQQSEADLLKSRVINEINEEANKNLLLIKPIVSEMNEKLVTYKKEFAALYGTMKSKVSAQQEEVRIQINGFTKELEEQKQAMIEALAVPVNEANLQLNSITDKMESSVGEAAASVRESYVRQLKKYEERVHALQGRIGDLKHIADTGQEMIEQRIDSVFENYRPEIERKITSLKKETEELYTRERNQIVERIGSIISDTDAALGDRERQIAAFEEDVDTRLKTSEEKLSGQEERIDEKLGGQEERIMENVNRVRIEARQELVRELESLKTLFKEERDRSVGRFRVELAGINEKVDEVNNRVDDIRGMVERKINEATAGVDGRVKEIETSYLKTGDELKERLERDLETMDGEVEKIREKVGGLKENVVSDVTGALDYFKKDVDRELEGHRELIYEKGRELQELVTSIADGAKSELQQSHREAEDTLKGFEDMVQATQERLENRVEGIEQRIRAFERDSTVLKRAVRFKEKVEEDIEQFSGIMLQLKEDKRDILSLRKVVDNLKRDEGDISAKVRQLKSEKKLVQDIAKNAEQAIGLITVVDEKIKLIEQEQELLDRIDSGMKDMKARFEDLNGKAEELATREKDIEVSIETIAKTKDFISQLEQRADLLNTNLVELRDREDNLKKKVSIIDGKTESLLNYEKRIEEVLSKFQEMDSLVTDIEERSKQLQSTREWLARTESRLTNLTRDAERLVDRLSASGSPSSRASNRGPAASDEDQPTLLSKESESKVKTVLTLFEQKWTIPEICKVTKMSRGEVELILELNNR